MKITVYVKPKAHEDKVEKLDEHTYRVATKEPPVQGRANRGVVELLARYLGIASARVTIAAGHTSKNKIIEIT